MSIISTDSRKDCHSVRAKQPTHEESVAFDRCGIYIAADMQATAQATKTWTILALIEWGTEYLNERGFEDSRLNVELLLSHILHFERIALYTKFDRPLSAAELSEFKSAFQRRLKHEPLQYIIGETEFMGLPLYVSPSVFIPRPETEELVEHALEWIRARSSDRIDVLDIGTGSGNIPIALDRFSPVISITSIDISAEALEVAARNIERHKCSRILLERGDVFNNMFPGRLFDVIIANPPYISLADFVSLPPEIKGFEPAVATTDNADGLKFIARICELAASKLHEKGALFMEIAHDQGAAAKRIAAEANLDDISIFKDLSGNERILCAQQRQ